MANAGELFLVPLVLLVFALAGGGYGTFFVIGKAGRSRLLLGIGWAFFTLQTVAGLLLLGSRFLGSGGKVFVAASWFGFAVLPSLAWARWARSDTEPGKGTGIR